MDEAILKYQKRREDRVKAREDAFEESKHKRDKSGRFTSGGGSESAEGNSEKQAILKKLKNGEKLGREGFEKAMFKYGGDKEVMRALEDSGRDYLKGKNSVSVGGKSASVPKHVYEAVAKAKWKDGEKYGDAEIDVPGVGKAIVKTEGKTKDGNARSGIYVQAHGESNPKRVATVEGRNGAMDAAKRHLLISASGSKKPREESNKPRRSFGKGKDWKDAESKDPKVRDAALRRLSFEEDGKKK